LGLLQFLVEGDEGLGNENPMDMVKGAPGTVDRLGRFARTLEDSTEPPVGSPDLNVPNGRRWRQWRRSTPNSMMSLQSLALLRLLSGFETTSLRVSQA
jgi:hypothetical protein